MIHAFSSRPRRVGHAASLNAILWVGLACGCSEPPPCIVTGTVLVNSSPTAGVYVQLRAADGQTAGAGRTGDDGSFRLQVKQPGEYPITCFFPEVTKVMDDIIEGDDQFQGRYGNPQQPVAKASVMPGDNPLPPIQLMR